MKVEKQSRRRTVICWNVVILIIIVHRNQDSLTDTREEVIKKDQLHFLDILLYL